MFMYRVMNLIGALGSSYVTASILSVVVLGYLVRWFVYRKAGVAGWKALIPFYSDYVHYQFVWEGRIYLILLIGSAASLVFSFTIGLIVPALGTFFAVVLNTIMLSASALANIILNFKTARAFGRSDYFALGLFALSGVFMPILAFGDAQYQGKPTGDGIDMSGSLDELSKRAATAAQQLQQQARAQQEKQRQAQEARRAAREQELARQQAATAQQAAAAQQAATAQQAQQNQSQPPRYDYQQSYAPQPQHYAQQSYAPQPQHHAQQGYNQQSYAPPQDYPQQPRQGYAQPPIDVQQPAYQRSRRTPRSVEQDEQ